jgi:hypothetical protein
MVNSLYCQEINFTKCIIYPNTLAVVVTGEPLNNTSLSLIHVTTAANCNSELVMHQLKICNWKEVCYIPLNNITYGISFPHMYSALIIPYA